jgi:hypothetical protein
MWPRRRCAFRNGSDEHCSRMISGCLPDARGGTTQREISHRCTTSAMAYMGAESFICCGNGRGGAIVPMLFGRRFGLLSLRKKIGQPKDVKLLFEARPMSKRPLLKTMAQTPLGIGSTEASPMDVRGIDAQVDRTQWSSRPSQGKVYQTPIDIGNRKIPPRRRRDISCSAASYGPSAGAERVFRFFVCRSAIVA